MIEMKVAALSMDPFTNMPIIVLKDDSGRHAVPIWVGLIEASAIVTQLEEIQLARPMTHDLLKEMLEKLGARVDRVEVTDVQDDTFYATIHLVSAPAAGHDGRATAIDSRPSDAIALALRTGAPIWVAPKVIERARCVDLTKLGPVAWMAGDGLPPDGMPPPLDEPPLDQPVPVLLEDLDDAEFPKWKM